MTNRRTMMNSSAIPEYIKLYKHQLKMSNLKSGEVCIAVTDMAFNPIYAVTLSCVTHSTSTGKFFLYKTCGLVHSKNGIIKCGRNCPLYKI